MVTWIWDVPAGDHRLIQPPPKERVREGERERGERERGAFSSPSRLTTVVIIIFIKYTSRGVLLTCARHHFISVIRAKRRRGVKGVMQNVFPCGWFQRAGKNQ